MVEGPGATRNANKAKQAIGWSVASFECSHSNLHSCKDKLIGRQLVESLSVGKEVFLIFSAKHSRHHDGCFYDNREGDRCSTGANDKETALRLHFGMSGVLWCQKEGAAGRPTPSWRTQQSTLAIKFVDTLPSSNFGQKGILLHTLDATANMVSANVARSKFTRLHKLDACNVDPEESPAGQFDAQAVSDTIQSKRPNDMICDAILNQDLFPGVGNIIKMEGLHLAKVHPQRIVSSVSQDELSAVIDQCRIYAVQWFRTGTAGPKMVYNQNLCQSCRHGNVRMVKMGNDLRRVTFWCDTCQPLNPKAGDSNKKSVPIRAPLRSIQYHEACPTHGTKGLKLKRVRKLDSGNALRIFRTCSIPKCSYFEWADTHFPNCKCQGRRTRTIIRVSKTQHSGGRWFFSCANADDPRKPSSRAGGNTITNNNNPYQQSQQKSARSQQHGCGFFEWASPPQLAPFGQTLSPLL
jgi:formamidopyrimidine-DNA glycosylase